MGMIYLFLSILLVIILYPLVYIISASLSSPIAVTSGRVWLFPVEPTLRGYTTALSNPQLMIGYANSLFYAFAGTLISTTLTIMAAYPLSRRNLVGRSLVMYLFAFTMLFSGGLIPLYLVVKELGLIDTRWALILPNALSVFLVIVARTFFQNNIPDELVEASEMDGCSDFRFILQIVLPLSKPIIAVLFLFYAVGQWNAYFDALIYLKSSHLFPLQLVLRSILLLNASAVSDIARFAEAQSMRELLKYCVIVLGSLPVMILYPFIQKYFVQGALIGSIKG